MTKTNNMKYRIKIITYKNSRKIYFAQVKKGLIWTGIGVRSETSLVYGECDSRAQALARIDLHYTGNNKVLLIEFEYVNH